jgi:TRAP-type mannitol/chloroaromatic compound transport system substrate-binding protein
VPVYAGVDQLPEIKLREATSIGPDTIYGKALSAFGKYLSDASNGKITVEYFWANSIIGANEVAEGSPPASLTSALWRRSMIPPPSPLPTG